MTTDLTGYWTGTFDGTNRGGFAIDIKQEQKTVTGTAKFSEPSLGQYEYTVVGSYDSDVSLRLTPARSFGDMNLGQIQVIGSIQSNDTITGRWQSTIGTEGVFDLKRYVLPAGSPTLPSQNSVFLVHGHDEGAMHGVARFLEQLGVTPVILQEQINKGMTIIEKFEDFASRAGFAIVLMTPDDFGYPVTSEQSKKHRARQNVVLELGYFAAKLGRHKTFVLVKGEVEIPSDVMGLVYTPMDRSEGWKIRLARELKACDFQIDLNRAIG